MKKTLFLTAILGAAFATQAQAGWSDTTYTLDSTAADAGVTIDKVATTEGAPESGTAYNIVVTTGTVASNADTTTGGKLTFSNTTSTLTIADNTTLTVTELDQFNGAGTLSPLTIQGGSLHVTGAALIDAFWEQTINLTSLNATLDQGFKVRNFWTTSNLSCINVDGCTLTLGDKIYSTKENGNNANLKFINNSSTIDVSGLTQTTYGDSTAPAAGENGFDTKNKGYVIADSTINTTIASGVTVTVKNGDETLGTLTSTDSGSGLYVKTGEAAGTAYYVQNGTVAASDIATAATAASTTYGSTVISSGNTLKIDKTDYISQLISSSGEGNVLLAANLGNVTMQGTSSVSGHLMIYNGTKLRVGTDQNQTNSVSSFSNVDLYGSSVIGRTMKLVLNNLTAHAVSGATTESPTTSTVKAYDMPNPVESNVDTVSLTLAGTTAVESNAKLVLMNAWKGRYNVAALTGAGDVEINGVNNNTDFDTAGTSTAQSAMTYTISDISGYTGTLTMNNNKATVNMTIAKACTFGGTITNTTSAGSSLTITATDGTVDLGSKTYGVSSLVIGDGANVTTSRSAAWQSSTTEDLYGIIKDGTITINGSGKLTTTANDVFGYAGDSRSYVSSVTLQGTAADAGAGTAAKTATLYLKAKPTLSSNLFMKGNAAVSGDDGDNSYIETFGGKITATGTSNTISTDITVNKNVTVEVTDASDALEISGDISKGYNNGSFTKSGAGTLTVSGSIATDNLTSTGTLNLKGVSTTISTLTLGGGSLTLGDVDSHDYDLTTTTMTVNADTALNANLVMSGDNKTLTFNNKAALTMGCTVSLDGTKFVVDNDTFNYILGQTGAYTLTLIDNVNATDVASASLEGLSVYSADGRTDAAIKLMYVEGTTAGVGKLVATPEPATATLSLLALAGLCARRRRH